MLYHLKHTKSQFLRRKKTGEGTKTVQFKMGDQFCKNVKIDVPKLYEF
jgi:hypothetical protein